MLCNVNIYNNKNIKIGQAVLTNMNAGLPKKALNLKQFLLKQEVKTLYRQIFRAIREVPDENQREELRDWARRDFRSNAHQTDEVAIKMLLNYGRRSLKELQTALNLAK